MKCNSCNDRKGNSRCEGCHQLYCLPCMSQHHNELMAHFELLIGTQKEVKEAYNAAEATWQTTKEHPCLTAIDHWEQEVITRVQHIAAKARATTRELMTKTLLDIRRRLDQLGFDMAQRQEEGNYLDNDIASVRSQLEYLNHSIKHIYEKVQINWSATNKIDWNALMYVSKEKRAPGRHFDSAELQCEHESSPQERLWHNLRKLIGMKYANSEYQSQRASFRQSVSSIFEPIALTSFGVRTQPPGQHYSKLPSESSNSETSQADPFSNEDPFNYATFNAISHEHFLPQASDA